MRVLLADDQIEVRSALRLLLEQEPEIQVVGESADSAGLLMAVARDEPDVILLDWELPGFPPDRLLSDLRCERPFLKIIAMSTRPEARQAAQSLGVAAFLSKGAQPERVLSLIRSLF